MTSTEPRKFLWIIMALLLCGSGAAAADQVPARPAEVRHDTPGIDNLTPMRTLTTPSNPGKTLIEPGKGMFLIAGRDLLDPNFVQSVVLLVDVDDYGVLGLVINRATEYKLAEVIPALQDHSTAADRLYLGGPVVTSTISLLMRSAQTTEGVHHVFDDVYFSTSFPVLETTLKKLDHEQTLRVYAGHSGWAPRQLQNELKRGDWYLVGADAELVFNTDPESIWALLIRSVSGLWVQNSTGQFPVIAQFP